MERDILYSGQIAQSTVSGEILYENQFNRVIIIINLNKLLIKKTVIFIFYT